MSHVVQQSPISVNQKQNIGAVSYCLELLVVEYKEPWSLLLIKVASGILIAHE